MLGAIAGNATGQNLTAFGDELSQPGDVLVVNGGLLLGTKIADFTLGASLFFRGGALLT
jgi:hypothetical protein